MLRELVTIAGALARYACLPASDRPAVTRPARACCCLVFSPTSAPPALFGLRSRACPCRDDRARSGRAVSSHVRSVGDSNVLRAMRSRSYGVRFVLAVDARPRFLRSNVCACMTELLTCLFTLSRVRECAFVPPSLLEGGWRRSHSKATNALFAPRETRTRYDPR